MRLFKKRKIAFISINKIIVEIDDDDDDDHDDDDDEDNSTNYA